MNQIYVSIRLRPIRFLYLISPSDSENLQNIFKINTCLWGGMYNPIVPYFKKVPNWWDREHKSFYSARKILDYHIDFFEPDFIVESKRGMSKSLNFCNEVTLQLNNILGSPSDRSSHEAYGLNVFELYKYLYQQEFKYVRRHEHNILNIKSEKKDFKAFCACVFGAFPNKKILSYIKRGFKDAFGPKEILLNAEKLSSLYSNHFASALEIGCKKLDISYSRNHDPTLFLLNASDPRDLIDYWNLRIVEKNVWAIPIQWIDHLSDFCKTFISKNHRPLPGNPHGVMIRTTIQMPRSISEEEGQSLTILY